MNFIWEHLPPSVNVTIQLTTENVLTAKIKFIKNEEKKKEQKRVVLRIYSTLKVTSERVKIDFAIQNVTELMHSSYMTQLTEEEILRQ